MKCFAHASELSYILSVTHCGLRGFELFRKIQNLKIHLRLALIFFVFVALCPKSTAMVMVGQSVHLATLFPRQA